MNRIATIYAGAVCALLLTAFTADAAPPPGRAHYHHLIGVRTAAGASHAAILFQASGSPGLNLRLAKENADAMEALAGQIHERVIWIETIQDPEEQKLVSQHLEEIRLLTLEVNESAGALRAWIDETGATSSVQASTYLRTRMQERCRVIFARYKEMDVLNRIVMEKLGMSPPSDPPMISRD
ncbi:MAG: hypothetical protein HKN20_10350 [Gemmatimonadetes bacterium]|nr:hypothetical protein [Gemmatimonadota bacterium]